MGDRIAVFQKGRIEQLGAPLELYQRPANTFVAGFLGAPRINQVDRPGAGATAAHNQLWDRLVPRGDAAQLGVRPEHLQVEAGGAGIQARVEAAEHLGDHSILYLRLDGVAELLRAKVATGAHLPAPGQSVAIAVDPQHVLRFGADGLRLDGTAPGASS